VRSFQANAFGLFDMSGNVWEWCWDWYDAKYPSKLLEFNNPRGPSSGSQKVIRGGSVKNGIGTNLGILYLGIESGDDAIRQAIGKGSTAAACIAAGRRVKAAGITLSVTVLLGIAGRDASLRHARATGELLTAMDPDFIGALTVMLIPGTPLYEDWKAGRFLLPDEAGLLMELREMIVHTHLTRGYFFSNHASNYLPLKAKLPSGKERALALIDAALRGEVGLKPEWLRAL